MSEMIERVAQELRNAAGMAADGPYNLSKLDSEYLAYAVIRAMREPTKRMVNAAAKAMSPERRPTPERVSVSQKHRIRYHAMIDEILDDKKAVAEWSDGKVRLQHLPTS